MSAPDSTALQPPRPPPWLRHIPVSPSVSEAEALYFAGAALALIDPVVHSDAPWLGAWRRRLALKSAAAVAATLMKRREDEAGLRDAFAFRRPGQDLGPAGRAYAAFRALSDAADPASAKKLAAVAVDLQSPIEAEKLDAIAAAARPASGRRPAPIAAASAARTTFTLAPGAEALALWIADATLAANLNWPLAVPLLAGEIFRPAEKASRRPRPGERDWSGLCALAYARAALAALDLAHDLFRRAARLAEAAPKLRAKGKGRAIQALLDEDVVSATQPFPDLSDRAQRRLFDRLVELGAVRELSGRPTFRLYGL